MDPIALLVADVRASPRKGVRITEISAETGIKRGTVRNIVYKPGHNPRMDVVRKLDLWAAVRRGGTQ